jgi:hypothetical protein
MKNNIDLQMEKLLSESASLASNNNLKIKIALECLNKAAAFLELASLNNSAEAVTLIMEKLSKKQG